MSIDILEEFNKQMCKEIDERFVKSIVDPVAFYAELASEKAVKLARKKAWQSKQPESLTVNGVKFKTCYHNCPYFALDGGGPGQFMICTHPHWNDKGSYAGTIISHPECTEGFPDRCPLLTTNEVT